MYAMSHKILIVDDDAHIREVLSFALGKAGMATAEAGDGEAALAAVDRDRPDLVVLDINMPRMDGLEVCRRLRAAGTYTPILVLTARSSEGDRVTGLETGADDYLTKPFSPRELVLRVESVLRRSLPTHGEANHDSSPRGTGRVPGDSLLRAGELVVEAARVELGHEDEAAAACARHASGR